MAKHPTTSAEELWRAFWLPGSVRLAQRLVPAVRLAHLRRGFCGIRAQALSNDGSLVDDFVFKEGLVSSMGLSDAQGVAQTRVLHVLNAPSPAATSSLAIANFIANRAQSAFRLSPSNSS